MACASFGLKCPQCSRTFTESVPSRTEWTTDKEWALQHRVHQHTTTAKSHTEVRMKDLKNVAIAVWLYDADGESTQVPYPEPKQPAAAPASQASRPASSSAPAPAPASASGGEPTTPWAKLEERIEVVLDQVYELNQRAYRIERAIFEQGWSTGQSSTNAARERSRSRRARR